MSVELSHSSKRCRQENLPLSQPDQNYWSELSGDHFFSIVSFLPLKDIFRSCRVSRKFQSSISLFLPGILKNWAKQGTFRFFNLYSYNHSQKSVERVLERIPKPQTLQWTSLLRRISGIQSAMLRRFGESKALNACEEQNPRALLIEHFADPYLQNVSFQSEDLQDYNFYELLYLVDVFFRAGVKSPELFQAITDRIKTFDLSSYPTSSLVSCLIRYTGLTVEEGDEFFEYMTGILLSRDLSILSLKELFTLFTNCSMRKEKYLELLLKIIRALENKNFSDLSAQELLDLTYEYGVVLRNVRGNNAGTVFEPDAPRDFLLKLKDALKKKPNASLQKTWPPSFSCAVLQFLKKRIIDPDFFHKANEIFLQNGFGNLCYAFSIIVHFQKLNCLNQAAFEKFLNCEVKKLLFDPKNTDLMQFGIQGLGLFIKLLYKHGQRDTAIFAKVVKEIQEQIDSYDAVIDVNDPIDEDLTGVIGDVIKICRGVGVNEGTLRQLKESFQQRLSEVDAPYDR